MRKCWLIAILLLVVGCSKDVDFEPSQDQAQNRILSGIIADEKDEDNESRVYLDNKIRIRWNKGDLISVFDGTTRNKEFAFLGADGSSAGDFEDNSAGTIGTGNAIDRLYGLYPYASSTEYCYGEDESEADYLRYTLPATQTYKPNSMGLNANIMVAATANKSDKDLVFRNVCSYLRLKLYGADQTVSSIVFKGNTDEVLSGDVAITATYGNAPTIKMLGAADEDNKTITLDCSEGVTVGSTSDEATEFWLVVPPVNFPNGFTITVKGEGNMGQEIVVNNNLTFARNTYNTITREVAMTEISNSSTEIPNNQIWYTSSDGKVVTPNAINVFGAKIVSNTYKNGKGVIKFDGAVTSIEDYEFDNRKSLTEITIPNSVTSIGDGAFEDCENLTSITIPNSVTSIGKGAFAYCSSLTSITIPNSVTSIGSAAFSNCSSLTNVSIGNSVTSIEYGAFYYCSSLTEVTIGNGVTSIGDNAFEYCSRLTSITLPNSVTSIGFWAFQNCRSLTEITIPNSVTSIGGYAFRGCSSLQKIICERETPPTGGQYMFYNIHSSAKIYVPAGSGEAYKTAQYWSDYASIIEEEESEPDDTWKIYYTATAKVEPYRENAFNVSIESNQWDSATGEGVITFNGEVNSIGSYAFYSCRNLKSIQIPENVTTIGTAAFRECFKLKDVYLNSKIKSIGNSAFVGCFDFYNSTYGSINFHMNSIADWCQIDLPTEVVSGQETIYLYVNGSLIKDIDIPSSINAIKPYAFKFCYVKKITMHKDVTSIGKEAFYDSPVDAIYCKSTTPPAGCEDMFKETSLSYIYVPEESVNSYKTAQYWSSYSSKITPYNFE